MREYTAWIDCKNRLFLIILCGHPSGEKPSDEEVERLLKLISKYTPASHLFWGLWGIISVSELLNNMV
jgi:hypothetical protein